MVSFPWRRMLGQGGAVDKLALLHVLLGALTILSAPVIMGLYSLFVSDVLWLVTHGLLIVSGGIALSVLGYFASPMIHEEIIGLKTRWEYLLVFGWVIWALAVGAGLGARL